MIQQRDATRPQRAWRNCLSKNGKGITDKIRPAIPRTGNHMVVLSALRQILATHQQRGPCHLYRLPNEQNVAKSHRF